MICSPPFISRHLTADEPTTCKSMISSGDIINILTSPLVDRIDFCMGPASGMVRVYPAGYHAIANRIRDGSIALESATDLPSNVSASFRTHPPMRPVIVTNRAASATSLESQMTIIHECTHALFNYNGIMLPTLYNETMCFIAEAVYLEAGRATGRWHQCLPSNFDVYESISRITRQIVTGTRYEVIEWDREIRLLMNELGGRYHLYR